MLIFLKQSCLTLLKNIINVDKYKSLPNLLKIISILTNNDFGHNDRKIF